MNCLGMNKGISDPSLTQAANEKNCTRLRLDCLRRSRSIVISSLFQACLYRVSAYANAAAPADCSGIADDPSSSPRARDLAISPTTSTCQISDSPLISLCVHHLCLCLMRNHPGRLEKTSGSRRVVMLRPMTRKGPTCNSGYRVFSLDIGDRYDITDVVCGKGSRTPTRQSQETLLNRENGCLGES